MGKVYKSFQKIYPFVILLEVIIIYIIYIIVIVNSKKISLSLGQDLVMHPQVYFIYSVSSISVILCVITVVKFRKISRKSTVDAAEYLKYSLEIKIPHTIIHIFFWNIGIIGVLFVYGVLISLTLLFAGGVLLFQTGYISSIGIKKLYKSGMINKSDYIKYTILQYVVILDVISLLKLCHKYCKE